MSSCPGVRFNDGFKAIRSVELMRFEGGSDQVGNVRERNPSIQECFYRYLVSGVENGGSRTPHLDGPIR